MSLKSESRTASSGQKKNTHLQPEAIFADKLPVVPWGDNPTRGTCRQRLAGAENKWLSCANLVPHGFSFCFGALSRYSGFQAGVFTPEIIYEGTFVINKNKSPKDESFVSVREEFVRPLGGRHSREARVRARFRRMRMEFEHRSYYW